MKAKFDGTWVRLGNEGRALYDQSGYGRPEDDGLRLSPEEASYLLHRGRIEIEGYSFDALIAYFARRADFLRTFLVYRDLRERGYAVQSGPHDFRVFRRGQRPGTGQSQYMVRVLSERDLIDFEALIHEALASSRMRKQHILAVVDDENELTYYEIKVENLQKAGEGAGMSPLEGILVGRSALVRSAPSGDRAIAGYGMHLDAERMILAPLEIIHLMATGTLVLRDGEKTVDSDHYFALAAAADRELGEKAAVYTDLRNRGYIPKTGYKFGHHFRVYSGQKVHSEMLVHAVARGIRLPMSSISRSVRLAHSVKKKMLFGHQHTTGIQYVEFARIKL
ncbi:MAG: tRNA-intron lyase [Methanomicrobiales archaeon]|nr:tRNA-intron lyase [Methanomicrobiales archaeon]NYT20785.1 tRNA-intron lyase [Methanomicrobiales archaeon]